MRTRFLFQFIAFPKQCNVKIHTDGKIDNGFPCKQTSQYLDSLLLQIHFG